MNIHITYWAQYEYSYNLANSRENWAQKKKLAARAKRRRETRGKKTTKAWQLL